MKVRQKNAAGKKVVAYMKRDNGQVVHCFYCKRKLELKDAVWHGTSNPVVRFEPRKMANGKWSERYYHMQCAATMRMPRTGGD